MDNKIVIEYISGGYHWEVQAFDGTMLCSGHKGTRQEAFLAAMQWIGEDE